MRVSGGSAAILSLVGGFAVGSLASAFAPSLATLLLSVSEPVGTLWVNAIRMTVIPLVIALLITGIDSLGDLRTVGRMGGWALATFVALLALMALGSALASPLLYSLFRLDADAAGALRAQAAESGASAAAVPPFSSWLTSLIPVNPVAAAADGAMLPLIIFTVAFALAVSTLGSESRRAVVGVFRGTGDAMLIVVRGVLWFSPLGIARAGGDARREARRVGGGNDRLLPGVAGRAAHRAGSSSSIRSRRSAGESRCARSCARSSPRRRSRSPRARRSPRSRRCSTRRSARCRCPARRRGLRPPVRGGRLSPLGGDHLGDVRAVHLATVRPSVRADLDRHVVAGGGGDEFRRPGDSQRRIADHRPDLRHARASGRGDRAPDRGGCDSRRLQDGAQRDGAHDVAADRESRNGERGTLHAGAA